MKLEGLNILIISNEPWGPVWYSKHNYAHELSKKNHVVFVNPATPIKARLGKESQHGLRAISPSLDVLTYGNALPAFPSISFRLNNSIVSSRIRRTLAVHKKLPDLLLSFDPCRLYDPALLGATRSLFIAVDRYFMSLPGERFLYPKVNGFVTLSRSFNSTYEPYHKPILTIGHAISSEEFDAPATDIGLTDYGLYVGALDHRLDLDLLHALITDHPDVPFVFIGPYLLEHNPKANLIFGERRPPNVHLLGKKPFKELASFIAGASFCLAPMDTALPGNNISHHKIFQYLAMGKPAFSTVFTEYSTISHLLYMGMDLSASRAALTNFLQHGEAPQLQEERIRFARSRTYGSIFRSIEEFMDRLP